MTGAEYDRVQAQIDLAQRALSKEGQLRAIMEALQLLLWAMPVDDYED